MVKEHGKVKSFRTSKKEETLLNECFALLHIDGESFNEKMKRFIREANKRLKKTNDLQERITTQEKIITEQQETIRKLEGQRLPNKQLPKIKDAKVSESLTQKEKLKPQLPSTVSAGSKLKPDMESGDSVLCPKTNEFILKQSCFALIGEGVCQNKDCQNYQYWAIYWSE